MQQQNSTLPAPDARAYADNFCQNRSAITILFDRYHAQRRQKALAGEINNLLMIQERKEAEYTALQVAFDDDPDTELIEKLAIMATELADLDERLDAAGEVLATVMGTLTLLNTEYIGIGGTIEVLKPVKALAV